MLSSLLSVRLPLDWQFAILAWMGYAHYLWGSFLAFCYFATFCNVPVALFGAITLTYAGYFIKPQNPCIVFTNAWIPGILIGGPIGAISFGLAILGGYWPVLIYFAPIALALNPEISAGLVLGLPQIIPFCWYWPKSIRHGRKADGKFGAVPLWRFFDLLAPDLGRTSINGVLFTEMSMYAGILALAFAIMAPISMWTGVMVGAAILSLGFAPFRIPARWLHLFTYGLVFTAVSGMSRVSSTQAAWFLLFLQAFDLSRNAGLQPIWPFCEWVKKPSQHFTNGLIALKENIGNFRVSGLPFPFFTGYLLGVRTLGYTGGFSLKKMCKFRGVTDSNGQSTHNWFDTCDFKNMTEEGWRAMWHGMRRYGVRYFFASKTLFELAKVKEPHGGSILEELECLTKTTSNS